MDPDYTYDWFEIGRGTDDCQDIQRTQAAPKSSRVAPWLRNVATDDVSELPTKPFEKGFDGLTMIQCSRSEVQSNNHALRVEASPLEVQE